MILNQKPFIFSSNQINLFSFLYKQNQPTNQQRQSTYIPHQISQIIQPTYKYKSTPLTINNNNNQPPIQTMLDHSTLQFSSGKRIYNIKVKSAKGYNSFQHMNPYQYLKEINLVLQQKGIDIKILEVKYLQTKSKAQKGFDSYESNRFDFQTDKTFNLITNTDHPFLDWIFADAVRLAKPENATDIDRFDNIIQEEQRKEEEKKITDIQRFLDRLMRISEEGKRMKERYDDMISFERFKSFDHACFKDGEYNVFLKALMSQPVKNKLEQEKQNKKAFIIEWKKTEIKSFFHPTPGVESADRVQELAEITSFTLGCSAPEPAFIEALRQKGDQYDRKEQKNGRFFYYDTQRLQAAIQEKHNQSIELRSLLAINRESSASDVIKSFEIQTQYFDQSTIKTQVNMGQIKKIQIYNGRIKDGIVEYYFYLAYPPKYFVSQLKREVATSEEYNVNWERIENIFFLRNKKIAKNEFLRLYLFNNTILKIKVDRKKCSDRGFQKAVEMLQILKQRFDDKISIPIDQISERILFQWGLKSLQSGFNYEKKFLNSLSNVKEENKVWILKYFVLIMVRYDHLYPSETNRIIDEIEKNLQDLDVYIYVFWKIATDIWGYNDRQKRFVEFLFDEVKSAKALNRTHMMKKIIKNTETIAHVFRMNSAPSGFLYAAPTPEMKGRLLKQYDKESQYFMRVAVCDDHEGTLKNQKYITKGALKSKMLEFNILNRKYIPLGWSPSQLRAYSLWYIHETNQTASGKRINREIVLSFLGNFSEIENPAKRAARIGQSFSASWTFDGSNIKERQEPDIMSENNFNFTDGIGKISKDLIESISLKLGLTQLSVIQIRYLGAKGILVLDQTLPKNTVVTRPSMIKYRCKNSEALKYLDILDYNKYKAGFLNRQVIILLKTLGISETVFEQLQKTHIKNISQMSFKDCSVFKQMNEDLNTEINNLQPANKTILSLVRAGFDLQIQPFFRGVLETMKKNGYNQLKNKCNIRVEKSARIIGIIDQYGVLEEDEVYCAIYDPFSLKKQSEKLQIIEEMAIITRNPCLDPADIRVVRCVGKTEIAAKFEQKSMNNKFEKFLNCVVFPQKGKVPLTAQISGSDLDGDNFFICWDQTLVPKKTDVRKIKTIDNPNAEKKSKPANIKKEDEMYQEMMNFFFEYINYEKLGQIDNSHLVKADKDLINYADNTDCLKLCEIHGKAVDFPKTGYCPEVDPKLLVNQYPDFMEKEGSQSYISQSILGKLYREIKQKIQDLLKDKVYKNDETLDIDLLRNAEMNFTKDDVYECMDNLLEYEKSLANLIKLVGIDTEYEVYSGNFSIAKQKVDQYGKTRLISTILQLKQRYFQIFFDGLAEDEDNYLEAKEENLQQEKTFSSDAKRRAVLYYVCSYIYKFGHKLRFPVHSEYLQKIRSWVNYCLESRNRLDKEGKFCGFIWFVVPKLIINIKKRALIEIRSQKGMVKGEKKEDEESDEEMKEKQQNDDSEEEEAI